MSTFVVGRNGSRHYVAVPLVSKDTVVGKSCFDEVDLGSFATRSNPGSLACCCLEDIRMLRCVLPARGGQASRVCRRLLGLTIWRSFLITCLPLRAVALSRMGHQSTCQSFVYAALAKCMCLVWHKLRRLSPKAVVLKDAALVLAVTSVSAGRIRHASCHCPRVSSAHYTARQVHLS